MFAGRTEELGFLEETQKKGGPRCLVLYGPYKVGKTELLKRFSKGKRSFFFSSAPCKKKDQLEQFRNRILSLVTDPRLAAKKTLTWDDMFAYVFDELGKKLSVIVIDEFSQLCREEKKLPILLKKHWEQAGKKHGLLLVISCSDVRFTREVLVEKKGAFSDENCAHLELNPLKFEAIDSFFPDYSHHDKVYCYAALGGVPGYLRTFDQKKTLEQNIKSELFDVDSFLFREPSLILQGQLREPALYFSILHAISEGNNRLDVIAEKTGIHSISTLNKYLYILRNLDIVRRDVPVTERDPERSRKGLYFFQDSYFRFWFRYIFPNLSYLEMEEKDIVWRRFLRPDSDRFVKETFVDICMQRLERLNKYKRLPFTTQKIGRWWDSKEIIDIVSFSEKEELMLCDCHWNGKKAGLGQLEELKRKSHRFSRQRKKFYGIFSKSGFTRDLYEHARVHDDVFLLNYY